MLQRKMWHSHMKMHLRILTPLCVLTFPTSAQGLLFVVFQVRGFDTHKNATIPGWELHMLLRAPPASPRDPSDLRRWSGSRPGAPAGGGWHWQFDDDNRDDGVRGSKSLVIALKGGPVHISLRTPLNPRFELQAKNPQKHLSSISLNWWSLN